LQAKEISEGNEDTILGEASLSAIFVAFFKLQKHEV
jgi:hypothetical protein